eukprot:1160571-Pelagomonas_calceolata.AAC.5
MECQWVVLRHFFLVRVASASTLCAASAVLRTGCMQAAHERTWEMVYWRVFGCETILEEKARQ